MERRLGAGASGAAPDAKPAVEEAAEEAAVETAPWPTEADEAAFRAGEPAAEAGATILVVPATPPQDDRPLPALDSLVARVPAEVREALDDLFRAKFTVVKRVPASALKSPS